ncbi:MAG TPA: 4Fe-4S binding protein [Clostridia bacterium]|nr:4Fe-4S binding protein [Clostridia bacterium]
MNLSKRRPGRISGAAIKNLFRKPATIPYMGGNLELDPRNRGLLVYDASTCISCGLCMKDCPTNAILVVNNGTKENPDRHAYLDTGRCIFCAQCVSSCPKDSLSYTSKSDLATLDKGVMKIEI